MLSSPPPTTLSSTDLRRWRRIALFAAAAVVALGFSARPAAAATTWTITLPNETPADPNSLFGTVSPSPGVTSPAGFLQIQAGDTVVWQYGGFATTPRNVEFGNVANCGPDGTFTQPSSPAPPSGWGVGVVGQVSRTFTAAGTYDYFDGGSCSSGGRAPTALAAGSNWAGEVVVTNGSGGGGGSPSAGLTASVAVAGQFKSVSISAASETFANCGGGSSSASTLGYPNGTCSTPTFTITNNGTVPEGVDVAGTNATASDGGHGWTLIAGGAAPATDQFQLQSAGQQSLFLSTSPQCDVNIGTCPSNSLGPTQHVNEALDLTGPAAATDAAASSFSTAVTYTAI